MYCIELIQQITHELWARKLRTFLALFGIIWGTCAVVLLLALGQSFYQANSKRIEALASGSIMVFPGVSGMAYQGYPLGRKIHLKASDVMMLSDAIPELTQVSPVLFSMLKLSHQGHQKYTAVAGVGSDYGSMLSVKAQSPGRFINYIDVNTSAKIIFLGDTLAQYLFPHQSALGKIVKLAGVPFKVVGVLDSREGSVVGGSSWNQRRAFIPYTTFINLQGNVDVFCFFGQPKDPSYNNYVKKRIFSVLGKKYHFSSTDDKALQVPDFGKMLVFFKWFFAAVRIFLGFSGALTLAVGGIGVANIMFLIVLERTREIGLRMALGASDAFIMSQILLEAFLIVTFGGVLGFILSAISLWSLRYIGLPSWFGVPTLSLSSVCVTIVILLLLTVLSGFFPARRAATMQPVDALSF